MLSWLWKRGRKAAEDGTRRARSRRVAPRTEALEGRQLLATAGVDYSLSGYSWANPARITYSIPTDGPDWDSKPSDLNAKLSIAFGGNAWRREVARSLQTWAAVANINVVPVADANLDLDVAGQGQGDARFGDIRIGGYDLTGNRTTLAQTYYPPPNGATGAGDVEVNTGFSWKPGSDFDFYSVLLHETGHSLGLGHSQQATAVLNGRYGGRRDGLTPHDVAGIQAIYGPRTPDPFQSTGRAVSFASAVDLTGVLDANATVTVSGVSLVQINGVEFFSVVAPAGSTGSTLRAAAIVSGISSLSPRIAVFDGNLTPLASQGNSDTWGVDAGTEIPGVVAGRRYYIAVGGATADVFAIGAYNLKFVFSGIPPTTPATPPVPLPGTPTTPTTPNVARDRFEPNNSFVALTNLGTVDRGGLADLTIDSTADVDLFAFAAARAGKATVSVGSAVVRVVNASGTIVATARGSASFSVPRAGATFYLVVSSADGKPVANYTLTVTLASPANRTTIKAKKARGKLVGDAYTIDGHDHDHDHQVTVQTPRRQGRVKLAPPKGARNLR